MSTNPPAVPADELPAAPSPVAVSTPMAQLYGALSKAQQSFAPIQRNREGQKGNRTFKYADLDEIIKATRPSLASNGLAVLQPIQSGDHGDELVTKLVHTGGAVEVSTLRIPMNTADIQSYGAVVTYLRRYAYQAILCISSDEDLDGDDLGQPGDSLVGEPTGVAMPKRKTGAQPSEATTESSAAAPAAAPALHTGEIDPTPCTSGEVAYLSKKIKAKGWTLANACEQAGLPVVGDEKALTKGYFNAIKSVV